MTGLLHDELLSAAARQTVQQMAAALPVEAMQPSAALEEKLTALFHRVKHQQTVRRVWQRTAAAVLALVLALGAVVAVSPRAQAAAQRWLMQVTDTVTRYWFAPTVGEAEPWDGLPRWTPEDSELVCDLQGDNGVRTLRYTTPRGDILLERLTMGGREYEVEIRSHETDGLSDATTGQRPMGQAGTPEGYAMTAMKIGPHEARCYHFHSGAGLSGGSGDYGVRCYQDGEWVHYLAVPVGASVLIWQDEAAQELFILLGSEAEILTRMAESVYQ